MMIYVIFHWKKRHINAVCVISNLIRDIHQICCLGTIGKKAAGAKLKK